MFGFAVEPWPPAVGDERTPMQISFGTSGESFGANDGSVDSDTEV